MIDSQRNRRPQGQVGQRQPQDRPEVQPEGEEPQGPAQRNVKHPACRQPQDQREGPGQQGVEHPFRPQHPL